MNFFFGFGSTVLASAIGSNIPALDKIVASSLMVTPPKTSFLLQNNPLQFGRHLPNLSLPCLRKSPGATNQRRLHFPHLLLSIGLPMLALPCVPEGQDEETDKPFFPGIESAPHCQ